MLNGGERRKKMRALLSYSAFCQCELHIHMDVCRCFRCTRTSYILLCTNNIHVLFFLFVHNGLYLFFAWAACSLSPLPRSLFSPSLFCLVQHRQLLNAIMQSYYNLMLAQRIMFYVLCVAAVDLCGFCVLNSRAHATARHTISHAKSIRKLWKLFYIDFVHVCVCSALEPHRKSPVQIELFRAEVINQIMLILFLFSFHVNSAECEFHRVCAWVLITVHRITCGHVSRQCWTEAKRRWSDQ